MAPERTAFVALGANLGDLAATLRRAIHALRSAPRCRVVALSPWYRTRAVGPGRQPDYVNGVLALATTREPLALLELLQSIEAAEGRVRAAHWGARTLDLDLLLYGGFACNSARLTVPHPRLRERNFVVYPLFDLAPTLVLPDGTPLARLRAALDSNGIVARLDSLEQLDD